MATDDDISNERKIRHSGHPGNLLLVVDLYSTRIQDTATKRQVRFANEPPDISV